jgi:hypothetical protein
MQSGGLVFIRAGMHWRIGEYPRTGMNKEALKFQPQVSKKNNLYRKLFPDFFLISAATLTSFPALGTGFQRNPAGLHGIFTFLSSACCIHASEICSGRAYDGLLILIFI